MSLRIVNKLVSVLFRFVKKRQPQSKQLWGNLPQLDSAFSGENYSWVFQGNGGVQQQMWHTWHMKCMKIMYLGGTEFRGKVSGFFRFAMWRCVLSSIANSLKTTEWAEMRSETKPCWAFVLTHGTRVQHSDKDRLIVSFDLWLYPSMINPLQLNLQIWKRIPKSCWPLLPNRTDSSRFVVETPSFADVMIWWHSAPLR